MSVIMRERFKGLESRRRLPRHDPGVRAAIVAGAVNRAAPAKVGGVMAIGDVGRVTFRWEPVTMTAAGKPLEALARYGVLYKYSDEPNIEPITEDNYDGIVYVDNTVLGLEIKRVMVEDDWVTQYVAVRIAAIDRWGRWGALSEQVEATTLFSRVPVVLDWGLVTVYNNIEYTIVREWPSLTVPSGYWYVITVFPPWAVLNYPPTSYLDFGPWISNFMYGLWWAEEIQNVSWPYLPPGTYTNVQLAVMHSRYVSGYATCYDNNNNTRLPYFTLDYTYRGLMRLGGQLWEREYDADPKHISTEQFQPVYWILWKIPL